MSFNNINPRLLRKRTGTFELVVYAAYLLAG